MKRKVFILVGVSSKKNRREKPSSPPASLLSLVLLRVRVVRAAAKPCYTTTTTTCCCLSSLLTLLLQLRPAGLSMYVQGERWGAPVFPSVRLISFSSSSPLLPLPSPLLRLLLRSALLRPCLRLVFSFFFFSSSFRLRFRCLGVAAVEAATVKG